jgi:hypothetical protein
MNLWIVQGISCQGSFPFIVGVSPAHDGHTTGNS